MSDTPPVRVDVEAARALVAWKSRFADEVAARAKQIAAEAHQPDHVTLAHYRQAVPLALDALAAAILNGGLSGDDQEAA